MAAGARAGAAQLKLDRSLGSPLFGSWRLEPEADVRHASHGLPGRVLPPLAGARPHAGGSSFLQTKTVVTHNHVHQQPGGAYVFLQDGPEQPVSVYRLDYIDGGAHGIAIHRITGMHASTPQHAYAAGRQLPAAA